MTRQTDTTPTAAHLAPEVWHQANRHLVRKAIAEFSHEQVLVPETLGPASRQGWQRHRLVSPDGLAVYEFDAQHMPLRHWHVDPMSVAKTLDGQAAALDALAFIIEFKQTLGLKPELLPIYLEEISSTLYGAAYKLGTGERSSAMLVDADFQAVEAAMSEGHPGFVANNGRIGFDARDYVAYTPEAGARFAVVWLAVRRTHAEFNSISGLSHEQLLIEELGPELLAQFHARLRAMDLNAEDYWLMPAHPWQWANKLAMGFAADVANRNIVFLGASEDEYQAQQSIRTFFNISQPTKRYVKTSLSILNMGFMRGLSPYYMSGTPAINEWVHSVVQGDGTLQAYGFMVLREVASLGYRNRYIEAAVDKDSAYRKMFSALWRESPLPLLKPGQKLMSMTALLHVDAQGESMLAHLIQRSGLDATTWVRRYLRTFLSPMLHCFYAHDLVFMPHGENLILVMEGHVPVRALMKDIAEECAVFNAGEHLTERTARIAIEMPDEFKLLFLFIDVFDGYFRHLQQVLVDAECMGHHEFWSLVAECAKSYQREHPEFAAKFERFDLFQPTFAHSCLNRLQLRNNTHMLNLADPASGLTFADPLENPIAGWRSGSAHQVDARRDEMAPVA
ncbi:MAG TPA: IucA/IucC family siderophore biosynthesis protein [Ideonella sp.]|uniref:IucA/IucC family protein n=1 Tax=Ideonella sp. TaxID=1929293 RepID=UPI002E31FE26|nr:IucA/IucC family siderophore biosynthesis protein [Ideonella sp.]HEX5687456.1 IucA/IucC family siderophore biosynthesis protein [Ideonella sp.]